MYICDTMPMLFADALSFFPNEQTDSIFAFLPL